MEIHPHFGKTSWNKGTATGCSGACSSVHHESKEVGYMAGSKMSLHPLGSNDA